MQSIRANNTNMIFYTIRLLNLKVGDKVLSSEYNSEVYEITEIRNDSYTYMASDNCSYNLYGFYSNTVFAELFVRTSGTIKLLICNRLSRIIKI